ncbi:EAL domain-containing protein [Methylorubrum salsuginis]|uniref:Cyclic-di-GMP phosphodiesterase, flagellum assembly factor TipF n=1 Tax=Methylorubrum salsuginis TaxID=414703 RepID=A0A1I4FP80_9HYPH|nr:EAL domain-containing protein [Methylorubrum salsuginis]SFL19635.1 cyclic-di-GMP phosphodiesterase, flagellum assembly factor TipF [Methylorubrum salsuginis]
MKTPTAPTIGSRRTPWILGLIVVLILVPLALYAPLMAAAGVSGLAVVSGFFLRRRLVAMAVAQEVVSREIGVLSQRLVKLEAVAAALVQTRHQAPPAAAAPPPAPGAAPETVAALETRLSSGIEEVTAEIGLLSGIVRELAAVVANQDGDIARVKAVQERMAQDRMSQERAARPAAPSAPMEAVPSALAPEPAARLVPRTTLPPPSRIEPPPRDAAAEAALVEAFDGEGLEVFLQPIVTLPQRKVTAYEALPRLKVGAEILDPELFLPVLERHGRTTALDRRMLQRVATIARHLQGRGSPAAVGYGLTPHSLFEPGFLRSLGRLVADGPDLAGRVVLALPQTSWRNLDAEQAALLAGLKGRIGFVMDRPSDLRFDAVALAERGISQVKVPAGLLLRPLPREAMPEIALEDLVTSLSRAGIRLVVTGVESESEVPDLIDLDVPLAQGAVFAAPRAVRAEVLTETNAPSPAPPPSPDPPPSPPPQRRPFRDFLRRAS